MTDIETGVKWREKKIIHESLPERKRTLRTDTPYEIITCAVVRQDNDTECGHIACYHVWNVIDPESAPADVKKFREAVVVELQDIVMSFDKELFVKRMKKDVPKDADDDLVLL